MISWDFVLERVKEELSYPFQLLEKTDEQIIDYLRRNALKKFSRFFPSKNRITIDTSDTSTQVTDRQGEYLIIDPDNRQVMNIVGIYPTSGHNVLLGHPFIGVFDYDSIPSYQLAVNKANTLEFYSPYHYTYEFYPPNRLRITPDYNGRFVVEYERLLEDELEDIRPELEDDFIELCIAMVMMNIGRTRKRYSQIATPFGEIQLNAEDIYSEGKQMYDTLMEKFDRLCLTTITIDRG